MTKSASEPTLNAAAVADTISSTQPLPPESLCAHAQPAVNTPIDVVMQHADFVIINKSSGVSFHSEQGAGLVVQASAALQMPLFPVHRLDKGTSGLLILAKNAKAAAAFGELFAKHQLQKFYLALSDAKPKQKQGWVKGDMGPGRRGAQKLLPTSDNPAVSYFISQGFADAPNLPSGSRLFLVKPWTGKTHQIRVALKSMAAPIMGDERYQGAAADRLYLHAFALQFQWQGELIQCCLAPNQGQYFQLPVLQQALVLWQQPWDLNWPQYQGPKQPKLSRKT